MSKKTTGIISIISILLSPLLGGLIGKVIANSNILDLHSVFNDDGLCYVGTIAWIAASIMFYVAFTKNDN